MRTEIICAPEISKDGGELKIAKWHKRKGSFVKNGEIIFTLENDVATCDFEAYHTGTLHYDNDVGAIVSPGQKIGSVTCIYQDPASDPSVSHSTWLQKHEDRIKNIIFTIIKIALVIYSIKKSTGIF